MRNGIEYFIFKQVNPWGRKSFLQKLNRFWVSLGRDRFPITGGDVQTCQIIRVVFGIFKATLVWDEVKGPWMTFKFPSSLEMFWGSLISRKPLFIPPGLAHSCAHVSSPPGRWLTSVPGGSRPRRRLETCFPRPFPAAHVSCLGAAPAAGASPEDRC